MERKLEMESRPISALGPAPQQLKEGEFHKEKKSGEEIPSILLSSTFKGSGRTEPPSLGRKHWDGAVRALLYKHLPNDTFPSFWCKKDLP